MSNKYNNIEVITSSKEVFKDKEFEFILVNKEEDGRLITLKYKEDYIAKITLNKKELLLENNIFIFKDIEGVEDKKIDNIEITFEIEDSTTIKKDFKIIYQEIIGNYLHFFKKDKDYSSDDFKWEIWNYNNNESKVEDFIDFTDLGVASFIQEENFIIRKNSKYNEWEEQTYSFNNLSFGDNKNLYVFYGVNEVFTRLEDVINIINPKIEIALMDEKDKINAFLSDLPIIDTEFYLYKNSILIKDCKYNIIESTKLLEFYDIKETISSKDIIEIRASSTYNPIKVNLRNIFNDFDYKGDLGINFNKDKINFSVFTLSGFKVELLIYDKNDVLISTYEMKEVEENIYGIDLNKDEVYKKFYLYRIYKKEINREGSLEVISKEVIDPYAKVVNLNGEKSYIIDLNDSQLKPIGWDNYRLEETETPIIYETHIRDFTIDLDKVPEKLRGKYLGFTYDDFEGDFGVKHLIDLGITHIQLMPIFDFSSVDERFSKSDRSWGYDPKNYNAVDGSYSINPYNPTLRIKELREMINNLHKNNIKVIMDVVYNHVADTTNLENASEFYYFRTDYKGRYTNGSGCGNELATERPMVKKLIIDSIKHWIENYKIDGFRFDLMELIDINTMKEIVETVKEINPNILVYGEPWKGGNSEVDGTHKGTQRNMGFSVFNDTFRDNIRGDNNPSQGFVNGGAHNKEIAWNIIEGLKGSINILTSNPEESINYVDAHDNFTLWDQIEKSLNKDRNLLDSGKIPEENIMDNKQVRRNVLALSIILTSQGIPFLHSGSEMLRTKYGDHNSYKSDDFTNSIKWENKKRNLEFYEYIKGLIRIRKEFNIFNLENKEEVTENLDISFLKDDDKSGVIKLHYKNNNDNNDNNDDNDINQILIIYNASSIEDYLIKPFEIPKCTGDTWKVIADYNKAGIDVLREIKRDEQFNVKAFSIMIMYS